MELKGGKREEWKASREGYGKERGREKEAGWKSSKGKRQGDFLFTSVCYLFHILCLFHSLPFSPTFYSPSSNCLFHGNQVSCVFVNSLGAASPHLSFEFWRQTSATHHERRGKRPIWASELHSNSALSFSLFYFTLIHSHYYLFFFRRHGLLILLFSSLISCIL